jgi:hypothetical protein
MFSRKFKSSAIYWVRIELRYFPEEDVREVLISGKTLNREGFVCERCKFAFINNIQRPPING